MRVEEISNLDALGVLALLLLGSVVLFRLVPAGDAPPTIRRTSYDDDEIRAYDRALPKYFVIAFAAVVVAAVHAAIKNVPPAHGWLAGGGHAGHLVRDIANTHLLIVLGGTVSASGLTWYVLPRVVRRPLIAPRLAGFSLWTTLVGAMGFYAVNVVVGILGARLAHDGRSWEAAEASFGAWKAVPVGLSATIMGLGYWTFVLVVVLTVWRSRHVTDPRPDRHLAWFLVVGALGLFAGTVQGVVQVMPAQEDWLRRAGAAGEYIDPIAHAHVNLVTGLLVLLIGLALWWTRDGRGTAWERRADRRTERAVFWTVVPASVGFYIAFLSLGFAEGRMIVDEGLSFDQAVAALGWRHHLPLALTGAATVAGLVHALAVVGGRLRRARIDPGVQRLLITSGALLLVGIGQGLVQLTPPVKRFIEVTGSHGDAVANAHAQLNMIGGVLLPAAGLALGRASHLLGAPVPRSALDTLRRRAVPAAGIIYVAALATAVAGGVAVRGGRTPGADPLAGVVGPSLQVVGSAMLAAGFGPVALWAWRATRAQRVAARRHARAALAAFDSPDPAWMRAVPRRWLVIAELVAASGGFPGIGWILAGRALVGVPLALVGPAMAWAVLPVVMSGDGPLSLARAGPVLSAGWIAVTAALSTASLALDLGRRQRRRLAT